MLKPISGNSPANQAQPLGNAIQALRQAPAKAAPKAAPQDSAEISDTGKAAAAKARNESQVELAVREAARRPAGSAGPAAVANAGRMLREQMTRATA